ncbi:hypothetical protein [Dongia sedimenti]|uniref:Uncharacterized protein n=1 Tax=Dongia sedimenti TaxID=3064282 RepID=A0ABU0YPN5_9PROT|nr:hypothetical protein [Rhodospirillaceae bacterium R-7]
MASSEASQPTDSDVRRKFQGSSGRFLLARWVVIGSFLTIFALVGAILGIARLPDNKDAADAADKTFNVILPVLASWVGTVLAFYFSSQSQEATSSSLNQAISQAGTKPPGSTTTVSEKMIATGSIKELINLGVTPVKEISLESLKQRFDGTLVDGKPKSDGQATASTPSRLIFVDKDIFRYVLHASTLNKYYVDKKIVPGVPPVDGQAQTFADLLQDPEYLKLISKLVVFVPATATLTEAKAALEAISGAQDIIVTGTGNFSGPMLGWLTNIDLAKALT